MRVEKFEPRDIDKFKPRPGEQYEVAEGSGLRVCVYSSGEKRFIVRFRFNGKTAKKTIGNASSMSLKDARAAAKIAFGEVAKGIDPNAEARGARQETSQEIGLMFRKFLDEHNRTRKGKPIRETAKVHNAGLLGFKRDGKGGWEETGNGVLSLWKGKSLHKITEKDVQQMFGEMSAETPVRANRVLSVLKVFFRWARVSPAPTEFIKPNPEESRERLIDDSELRKLWLACDAEPYPMGNLFRLLALTGCRRDEIRAGRDSWVDTKARTYTIPGTHTKNGREHVVPLSDMALAIFEALPRINDSDFLFTLDGKQPICEPTRPMDRLCKRAKVFDWTLHDLRRTLATGLQRLGLPIEVTEACLNHKSGTVSGVAAIYAKHDYAAEKREALDAWARHIEALIKQQPAQVLAYQRRVVP